mmetsp:Transcript_36850/g.83374  ORF Transcript_36850/g.83374 Transcript_36850/m.83374 type:complete len:115 (+) Transcript_36850:20-364(+)
MILKHTSTGQCSLSSTDVHADTNFQGTTTDPGITLCTSSDPRRACLCYTCTHTHTSSMARRAAFLPLKQFKPLSIWTTAFLCGTLPRPSRVLKSLSLPQNHRVKSLGAHLLQEA